MSYQTSAELLAGFKFMAMRPGTDESIADADIYTLLEEGQKHAFITISTHVPEVLYGAPTKLTTTDGGATYTFPSAVFPFGSVEIRASRNGSVLVPGAEWSNADFVWEGDQIRIPNGRTRTFSDGPYARYIAPPGVLNGSNQPTLKPPMARSMILYYALYLWAERGGGMNQVDPNRFLGLYQSVWAGDPRIPGDMGILGMLKRQGYGQGLSSIVSENPWWRASADLG
jgi:hypothetical protein